MELSRKRGYSSQAATIGEQIYAKSPQTSSVERHKRSRPSKEFPTKSKFDDLNNHYNYEVDVEDVLEDYLSPRKRKDIRPLVLDTEDGDWSVIAEFDHCGSLIKSGTCVMLKNGTFLKVKQILMEFDHSHVVLRGHRLAYVRRLRPILDDYIAQNSRELFLDWQVNRKLDTSLENQALIDIPLGWVEKFATIYFTNCERAEDYDHRIGNYFCRWKLIRYYEDTQKERKSVEVAIERLTSAEADSAHRIPDEAVKINWRGPTKKGGSQGDEYTAVDGFCCGGGWSRGAQMAGKIKVLRSFDKDPKACSTYMVNFPKTSCLNVDVFDYCLPNRLQDDLKDLASTPRYVDIAHYSTPCQFFSPAHTKEGPNDETNFAASFCLWHLLNKDKPRVMTFENTAGLERRHFNSLKAIFGQVTSLNYSLRFACLHLAEHGLSQDRRRLIMLASCPGEPLPNFPARTHSRNGDIPGILPFVTLLETISNVPFGGWQNHFPSQMKKKEPPSKLRTLAPTMTCAGGTENVHPDGRSFTICESQLLQGFPLHHRFAKELKRTNILAQIGNAFPPLFVKKLLRHIRRQLQNTDGVPESIDADEFMSSKEIREQEVAQFFKDHEDLPEGTRANIVYTEGAYQEDDDEEESETAGFILVNDPMETSWSWITSDSNTRRSSSDSSPSNSSQNSSATFVANPRIMPESIRNMNDTLADSPNDTISQVTRSWYSWTSQSAQVSKQSGSELHEVHSSTTLDLKRQRLGQEVECVEIKKPMNLMDSSLKICGSSNDNPIEL